MNQPIRARYGAKNNTHELLAYEGDERLPPGYLGPSDCWWPSVGCGPVGEWWALWWTEPDNTTQRAGMVRSEVALWRNDEIGAVENLRPVMMALCGNKSISSSSTDLLQAVATELISSDTARSPVFPGLDVWPGILADLWTRLWPEVRRAFSARVAISPPQGGESVTPPLMFCVPSTRLPEWERTHHVIKIGAKSDADAPEQAVTRAAAWLTGNPDPGLEEVLQVCNSHLVEVKDIRKVARAAGSLDQLRASPKPEHSLELLRTLIVLAPDANIGTALKAEALLNLNQSFTDVTPEFVLSLRNLKPMALPTDSLPLQPLTVWIRQQATCLSLDQARQFLVGLKRDSSELWWQHGVKAALSERLANPDARWAKAATLWLGLPSCEEVLNEILPATEETETQLFDVVATVELSEAALQRLMPQTVMRGWSRLHAWAVMEAFPPRDALHAQRNFPGNPLPGLKLLVEDLPGVEVIAALISTPDTEMTRLVAQRTAREPTLLQTLDASLPAWRALWVAHVEAGGMFWPPDVNRTALGTALLDAALTGDEPTTLITKLASDLAEIALDYPRRTDLWQALSGNGLAALLPLVANALIQQCDAGQTTSVPEFQLIEAVIKQFRKSPSSTVLVALLSWKAQLNEQDVIDCLSLTSRKHWSHDSASSIGKAISANKWTRAADQLYDRHNIPEFRSALENCYDLLPLWKRFKLSLAGIGNNTSSAERNDTFVRRIAELGAELAPDELDFIWERAGGKHQQLPTGGTPSSRWQDAARLAHQGTLKNGLPALIRELKAERPHNIDLNELEQLITPHLRN
ncbi:effector-associated domain EAD1-containing protein [Candidatus Methylospira mobilis]|uniref:GAP1-N1 domain-containing protein n=1 Tax=Candidatus Methylospira mobilis TaxID=1808979 RepID=UPI0028E6E0CC|nr:effector-associated domain EAD1-containing protein [Candidatus Methylospira mobilis]WNV06453.1 effector-associated domain EAD1-containing protein [Candidatus Methylospira mobilis]